MTESQEMITEGFKQLRDEQGITFTLGGSDYVGIMDSNVLGADLEPGGYLEKADFEIHCLVEDLVNNQPAKGMLLVIPSGSFRIDYIARSDDDVLYRIGCTSERR